MPVNCPLPHTPRLKGGSQSKSKLALLPTDGQQGAAYYVTSYAEEYSKFFQLAALRPEAVLVPSEWVEKVWVRHVLDTHAYAADCGAFLPQHLHYCPIREEPVCL